MRLKIIKSPRFKGETDYLPPLAISQIYSFLKNKGFEISQEDLNQREVPSKKDIFGSTYKKRLKNIFSREFSAYLTTGKDDHYEAIASQYLSSGEMDSIDILLVSICYSDFCSSMAALLIARYFKSKNRNKLVIMGGESIEKSYIYEGFEKYNTLGIVDYYILGPGEESLLMLLKRIQGEALDPKKIPGLCYRQDGQVFKNDPIRDAALVPPDFTGLSLKKYSWDQSEIFHSMSPKLFPRREILVLPFRMIDGCPYRCAFCASPDMSQARTSSVDPQEAVSVLKRLTAEHNAKYFMFLHDTLNFSKAFINHFCDELIKADLDIRWSDSLSPLAVDGPEVLNKMYRAGARRVFFGLESASTKLQAYTGKNVNPARAAQIVKWAHEAGLWTGVQVIAGFPHETKEDIQSTVDFIIDCAPYLDVVKLQKFYLRRYTYMHSDAKKYGITNIREYDDLPELVVRQRGQNRYRFDEIGGLEWNQKEKQIERSYRTFDRLITEYRLKSYSPRDELNILFYLYECLEDKKRIKSAFDIYQAELKKVNKLSLDLQDLDE
ncbi:MAG: radical SAM protein [Candidatus Omnitrophica bacterium]|nr:radical SAM protein [Candidatus Omnitrophota bacterium]MDE2221583.1 radical SAM protein [Candidatus Omnitrophota bacterium]